MASPTSSGWPTRPMPHTWSAEQHAFLPRRDAELKAAEGLYIAGDGAGISGAEVAWLEGQLVGCLIAGHDISAVQREISRAQAVRPFLDRLYRPAKHLRNPSDDTVLCRCEAVTAGSIRRAVQDGAPGPNQVKFMLRAGMGPCQGRVCGIAVSEVIADSLGQDMQHTGYFRIRPPLKPIPLGIIAEEPDATPSVNNLSTKDTQREEVTQST